MAENNYGKTVGMLVGFLIAMVIGVMVYYAFVGNVDEIAGSTTETITQDTDGNTFSRYVALSGSNYTGETFEVDYAIHSVTTLNAYNASGTHATLTEGTGEGNFIVNGNLVTIVPDKTGTGSSLDNFTQVNITYVSEAGQAVAGGGGVNSMASTLFGLLPIVAVVVVASVILFLIIGFGGNRKT